MRALLPYLDMKPHRVETKLLVNPSGFLLSTIDAFHVGRRDHLEFAYADKVVAEYPSEFLSAFEAGFDEALHFESGADDKHMNFRITVEELRVLDPTNAGRFRLLGCFAARDLLKQLVDSEQKAES